MKNLFIGLLMLAGSASFANNSVVGTGSKLKADTKKEVKSDKDVHCCTARQGLNSVTVCGGGNECARAVKAVIAL